MVFHTEIRLLSVRFDLYVDLIVWILRSNLFLLDKWIDIYNIYDAACGDNGNNSSTSRV